jgi:hypothetical protein
MVLLEIDAKRVAILELECDAPRPIDMNAIAERRAPKRVEIEAGNVHVLGKRRSIESIKTAQTAIVEHLLDAGGRAPLEQFLQTLVPETPDHILPVTSQLTSVNNLVTDAGRERAGICLCKSSGSSLNSTELPAIIRIVTKDRAPILSAGHDHFSNGGPI